MTKKVERPPLPPDDRLSELVQPRFAQDNRSRTGTSPNSQDWDDELRHARRRGEEVRWNDWANLRLDEIRRIMVHWAESKPETMVSCYDLWWPEVSEGPLDVLPATPVCKRPARGT